MRNSVLNFGAFFIIIPRGNHKERHGVIWVIVLPKNVERIFEGLAATSVDVSVEAP